ncbi:hypothetical protein FRC09_005742 [Ceratobasidium sp. 395]|nr:hypothetical protein FRC09_005742 [Ceratobasidium sp. 395]
MPSTRRKALSVVAPLPPSPLSRRADLSSPPVSPTQPPVPSPDVTRTLESQAPVEDEPIAELSASAAAPSADGDALKRAQVPESKAPETGPIDPPNDPSEAPAVDSTQAAEAKTLSAATQKTEQKVANPRSGSDIRAYLCFPAGSTGTPIIDRVLNDLRLSRHCFWLADTHLINANCVWRGDNSKSWVSTLQWKEGASIKQNDGEGDVVLGMIGMVSPEGCNAGPDAGFQIGWGAEKISKQKRTIKIVSPDPSTNISQERYNLQLEGAHRLVQQAMKSASKENGGITHCFVNQKDGFTRFRSPLFDPPQPMPDDGEYDATPDCSVEEDLPEGFGIDTWNMASPAVESAFRRSVDNGFRPRAFEAFNRYDKRIHPNQVNATLAGAVVLVYFTLERMRFPRDKGTRTEYQFYGNLVRVQVLKLGLLSKPAPKRKFMVHGYGPDDYHGSGNEPTGESAPKKPRIAAAV